MARSILDRDEARPIIVRGDDNTDEWIILALTVIILFVVWGIIVYLVIDSFPNIDNGSSGNTEILATCPPGQCATNIFNGEKRCPPPTGSIIYDAGTEVCNTATLCDNNSTPYAVQSDGSTNFQGICQDGANCRCFRFPTCAQYITSLFITTGGNPYGSVPGTQTTFGQSSSYTNPNTGISSTNSPLGYTDVSTSFCTIPIDWLPRSTPGCSFSESMTADSITECMGGQSSRGGALFNPCLRGTLAFVTDDSDTFTADSIQRIPLACVAADPCSCGQVAVWDTNMGGVVCKTIT